MFLSKEKESICMDHRSFVVRDATATSLNPSVRSTLTRIQFSTRSSIHAASPVRLSCNDEQGAPPGHPARDRA